MSKKRSPVPDDRRCVAVTAAGNQCEAGRAAGKTTCPTHSLTEAERRARAIAASEKALAARRRAAGLRKADPGRIAGDRGGWRRRRARASALRAVRQAPAPKRQAQEPLVTAPDWLRPMLAPAREIEAERPGVAAERKQPKPEENPAAGFQSAAYLRRVGDDTARQLAAEREERQRIEALEEAQLQRFAE